MTVESLLELAARCARPANGDVSLALVKQLGQGVIDLLGEAEPCGYEEPETTTHIPRSVIVPSSWAAAVDPDDARAMARMLFAAADESEG